MKKKTMCAVLCVALLLFFTSLTSGGDTPPIRDLKVQAIGQHGWQDDIPNQSPARGNSISNANVISHLNRGDITIVVHITFGDYDLFLIQHKSESTSER